MTNNTEQQTASGLLTHLDTIRVGVYQGGLATGLRENLDLLRAVVSRGKVLKLDVLLFSELFLHGYGSRELLKSTAELQDGPVSQEVSNIAKENGVAIAYGYSEKSALDTRTFDSARFIGKDGTTLANYRKTHLWGPYEKKFFSAGSLLSPVFSYAGWKFAFAICYDVEFPEIPRSLCLRGASILLVPTANGEPFIARTTLASRAYENHMFICCANRVGQERYSTPDGNKLEFSFCGLSAVVAPDGTDLVRADNSSQELIVTELCDDRTGYIQARTENPYMKDRRPELYRDVVKKAI